MAGLLLAFHPMLLSGLERMPTDPGDTLFNNFQLEHSWQWLAGGDARPPFWSPRIGHPVTGTYAYSDLLLGFAPPYWGLRALGFDAYTSMQLWMLVMGALNFALAYALMRREIGRSPLAAAFGAFLFAFAASRINQLGHQQLLPQLYLLGAFWALLRIFRPAEPEPGPAGERGAIALFVACAVAQLYSSFYNAYFLILASAVALCWALILRPTRERVVGLARTHALALGVAGIVGLALVAPLLHQYWQTSVATGGRSPGYGLVPRLHSYLLVNPWSWLYGWMHEIEPFRSLEARHEHATGLGWITSGLLVWVGWRQRQRTSVLLGLLVAASLVSLLTILPDGSTLYDFARRVVPGLFVLTAVSRVGLLWLLPAALALAWWVDARPPGRAASAPALLLAGACLLEQGTSMPTFDKAASREAVIAIAEAVDPSAEAFFVIATDRDHGPYWLFQIRAILAQQRAGVPSVNLYSGARPVNWDLDESRMADAADRARIEESLGRWTRSHGLDPERVQRIYVRGRDVVPAPAP